jgi:hypothetical protein
MPGEKRQPIGLNRRGSCPHCGVTIELTAPFAGYPAGSFMRPAVKRLVTVSNGGCPACGEPIVFAHEQELVDIAQGSRAGALLATRYIWPTSTPPRSVPAEVPLSIRRDYTEAAAVISLSEEASAALSRRCLQLLLRESAGTKSKDLADQIDEVLPSLPGYLQQQLDAVRNIGNFGAHPQKSKSTGGIVEVEAGEAEWNLDVLDLLFDFYYVQPKIAQEKRDALNKKLADIGKPAMK